MSNFTSQYAALINRCLNGAVIYNERTKEKCFVSLHDQIQLDLTDGTPICGFRKTLPHIAAAEVAWAFMGTTDPTWLRQYTKVWDAFRDEHGNLQSSYGYRWRHAFGVDQLNETIGKLKETPGSRQAVVFSWNPTTDVRTEDKNVPCPVGFTYMVMDNKVYLDVYMRSSDTVLGLPVDMPYFAFMNIIMANELGLTPGKVTLRLTNAHVYERHAELIKPVLADAESYLDLHIPHFHENFKQVMDDPDFFVEKIRSWSPVHPTVVKFNCVV